jgi:hypothetical protein
MDQLPAAPIRLDFPHHVLVGDADRLEEAYDVRVAQQTTDGKLAVRRALLKEQTAGIDVIPPAIAADANDALTLVDFVFSEFRRDDPDFDIAQQTFSRNKMMTFEIFD